MSTSKKLFSINLLIIVLMVFSLFLIPQNTAEAETIGSDTRPILRWAQTGACDCNEDYSIRDTNIHYCSGSGNVVYNNVEVEIRGNDQFNSQVLTHYPSLSIAEQPSSLQQTHGDVELTYTNLIPTSGRYKLYSDGRKLKNLTSELRINGSNDKVGKGQVLIRKRHSNGENWSAWSHYNLSEVNSYSEARNFVIGDIVCIVIIYEIQESPNVFKFHHIRLNYAFQVTAALS